jgi:hypothetical protein
MAEPDLRELQTMVQRVLDEQRALREFVEMQLAMIRNHDQVAASKAKTPAA